MKCWPKKAFSIAWTALLLLAFLPGVPPSWAQDSTEQDGSETAFRRVSDRLLCQCGCNYMVLSCNHLDCPSATYIRNTIRASLAEGQTEDAIVASFVEQYGVRVLPEPPKEGFSWMAWIMPFLALVLGGGAVTYVLWLWKWKAAQESATPDESPEAPSPEVSPALVEKYRAQIDEELEKE
ncbi:MAG: cytochrome c-type biogenesis protein CcmH [Acidobacteria bacterium]|nr:cytochrome c-type biogenesis protein CcmH [Acidobacteriota bacterium]